MKIKKPIFFESKALLNEVERFLFFLYIYIFLICYLKVDLFMLFSKAFRIQYLKK